MKKYILFILIAAAVGGGYLFPKIKTSLGVNIPLVPAVFEDALQASITSSATSFTLIRGTDGDGNNLDGYYGFVIDEGTSSEEFVTATCSATSCTSVTRGVSTKTATSTVSALQFSHRRGASVKITDHPVLGILRAIINGVERLPNLIGYAQRFDSSTASTSDLVDKRYVDGVGAGGFTAANVADNLGLKAQGTSPETVGIYISATSSALRFGGIGDDQLFVKYANSLRIGTGGQLGVATTTDFTWTGNHTFDQATTTILVVGSSNPTWPTRSGLWVSGSATSTASISATDFCFSGANCFSSIGRVASSTAATNTLTGTATQTAVKTVTITSGYAATNDVMRITGGLRKSAGTAGTVHFNIRVNGLLVWDEDSGNGCNPEGTAVDDAVTGWVEIIFGLNNNATIYGSCLASMDATPSANSQAAASYATTTLKFSSEAWNISYMGKLSNSADTLSLDGFSIVKLNR